MTEQSWSIKDLLYGFGGDFSSRIQRLVPSGHIIKTFFSGMTCRNVSTIHRFVVFQNEVICLRQVENRVSHMYAKVHLMPEDSQQNANFYVN